MKLSVDRISRNKKAFMSSGMSVEMFQPHWVFRVEVVQKHCFESVVFLLY